jgi:hypothetical protein
MAPQLSPAVRQHQAIVSTHRLCAAVDGCETAGVPREHIRATLTRTRGIFGRSTFIARLLQWPRGYPGDFETIEPGTITIERDGTGLALLGRLTLEL